MHFPPTLSTEKLLVQPDAALYHFINQGVLTVDGVDDEEEMQAADVCNDEKANIRAAGI